MCGSSGGGGDGGAAEREAARQAQQDAAIAQIDELFGIERSYPTTNTTIGAVSGAEGVSQFITNLRGMPGAISPQIDVNSSNAAKNKAAREAQYSTVRDDVINFYQPDLDQQQRDAQGSLSASLASRGLTGGSVDIAQNADLQDRYLRGVLDLTNKGDAAANDIRSADSRTRLDMISLINAGADAGTALNSSAAAMDANTSAARDAALGQGIGNFFDDMIFLQRAKNDYLSGQQFQQQMSPYYSPKTSTSGSSGQVIKVGS